jgi:hypothetical protein
MEIGGDRRSGKDGSLDAQQQAWRVVDSDCPTYTGPAVRIRSL